MFGFGFKGKTKKVLQEHFQYSLGAIHSPVLSGIVSQAKMTGVNEYDAAIMFMTTMMNSLSGHDPRTEDFINTHVENIKRIIHLANSPPQDIYQIIDLIKSNHEMGEEQSVETEDLEYDTFEEWLEAFRIKFAEVNPRLAVSSDNTSLIDFMDHEPLRNAFTDKVSPEVVATGFAQSFDPRTFGN